MKEQEHRPGVSEVNLVVRNLELIVADSSTMAAAIADLDQTYGMDSVSFDDGTQVLNVAYDASHTGIDCVEEILAKHGIDVSHDWWTRVKKGHYRFVDQNVKDNVSHEPWSCHKAPPRGGRRGK